jgi:hypothetical protein
MLAPTVQLRVNHWPHALETGTPVAPVLEADRGLGLLSYEWAIQTAVAQ